MKIYPVAFFLLVFILSGGVSQAQEVEVIKFPDLEKIISEQDGKVKVINFWATWCKPCIKELPYFEALQQENEGKGLQVYLISFDDVENLENRVKPFIEKREISSTVKLLDETDYNAFIDKIDPSWSGAIPATLVISGKNRLFKEGELDEAGLREMTDQVRSGKK